MKKAKFSGHQVKRILKQHEVGILAAKLAAEQILIAT